MDNCFCNVSARPFLDKLIGSSGKEQTADKPRGNPRKIHRKFVEPARALHLVAVHGYTQLLRLAYGLASRDITGRSPHEGLSARENPSFAIMRRQDSFVRTSKSIRTSRLST